MHRLSCSVACGILPDQGSNLCLLYWQTESLPLSHQESPVSFFLTQKTILYIACSFFFKNLTTSSGYLSMSAHIKFFLWFLDTIPLVSPTLAQTVKNLPAMQETPGSIPGLGRSPGEGSGNPLQYSCLENLMDRVAWWATVVHEVEKSRIQLK